MHFGFYEKLSIDYLLKLVTALLENHGKEKRDSIREYNQGYY